MTAPPFGLRRGAQKAAGQGWRLFEPVGRVEPDPAGFEHRRLPRRSRGRRQQGRLFFAYFLLAKQKKVSALSGAHPDIPARRGETRHATTTTTPTSASNQSPLRPPTPAPAVVPRETPSPPQTKPPRLVQGACRSWPMCRARPVGESPARTHRHEANNLNSCWRDRPNGIGWVS